MSAILYENTSRTVFLVDIPASIATAQNITAHSSAKWSIKENINENDHQDAEINYGGALLSSPPLLNPYQNQPEPKTAKARARVLERIPESELSFYGKASPLITAALQEIGENHTGDWCLERQVLVDNQQRTKKRKANPEDAAGDPNSLQQKTHRANSPTISTGWKEPVLSDPAIGPVCQEPLEGESPLVLSPSINLFSSLSEIRDILVKNTSFSPATIQINQRELHEPRTKIFEGEETSQKNGNSGHNDAYQQMPNDSIPFRIPPGSTFILTSIRAPLHHQHAKQNPIPHLPPTAKFKFILLDPPWHNRSVSRSRKYATESSKAALESVLGNILKVHIEPTRGIAGIWVTNSAAVRSTAHEALRAASLVPFEEWIWIKTTTSGEPVVPIDGVWRKPYEVLILARREENQQEGKTGRDREEVKRRVIAAVPDVHSRKPNLKELVERIFFSSSATLDDGDAGHAGMEERHVHEYSALEVYARNLTAGWTSCGDEVLRFNWDGWWL